MKVSRKTPSFEEYVELLAEDYRTKIAVLFCTARINLGLQKEFDATHRDLLLKSFYTQQRQLRPEYVQ